MGEPPPPLALVRGLSKKSLSGLSVLPEREGEEEEEEEDGGGGSVGGEAHAF